MNPVSSLSDLELIEAIKAEDQKAFRGLFDRYYRYLLVTAYNYVPDENLIKDFTQEVFFELWKRRKTLDIQNVKAYLRRTVINKSLNHIKAQRLNFQEENEIFDLPQRAEAQENLEAEELQQVINKAIESLPEKCRIVFALRRFEDMPLKEIAQKLDISTKTVENQLTKALKVLRRAVAPFVSENE